ncbi:RHS repeat-associated core domain-containing protein [Neobacillus notoginsengisoli]|uniref:RHS repeat-associated core domain-containing protein n=1 Tax=Neobacillus notoginsengisoli TaxID=1578198 RepID=UPI001314381E|nr:RHS repeat-associated core domain-containing protein [Neobacillus notoginsengisoli]
MIPLLEPGYTAALTCTQTINKTDPIDPDPGGCTLPPGTGEHVNPSVSSDDLISGIEDYFTYHTHSMGNLTGSVNVTTGNMNLQVTDHSLFTRGKQGFSLTRFYNSKSTQSSALGKGWTFQGNESLHKKSTELQDIYYLDEDGTAHEFLFNPTTASFISPKGKYFILKKETVNGTKGFSLTDGHGNIKFFEEVPLSSTRYRLYSYQDPYNNLILFRYTNLSTRLREISEVDSSGTIRNSITLTYNLEGMLTKTIFKDRWVEYEYNKKKQLIATIVKASGTAKTITNSYDYDSVYGYMTAFTDGKGNTNTFSYENNRLSILTPQADGKDSIETTYTFDISANSYKVSDTQGKTTTYKRDSAKNTFAVTDVINQDGTTSKTTYDANYNVLTVTDENGKTETNQFDQNGNLIKATDKEGKITSYAYDDKNQVIERMDPNGVKTVNVYNDYKLISSQTGQEITKYESDSYGRETKVTYPNNTYTMTSYDEANKMITKTDTKGVTTRTVYNDYGQVISESDGEGRTTSYTFDLLNPDLKTSVTDGNGNKTSYVYDANGNMTSLTNPNGKVKSYKYDGNDQLVESLFPISSTQSIKTLKVYDINGNLQKTQLQSGISKNVVYDEVDQVANVTVKNSAGQATLHWVNTYDNAGQLLNRSFKDLLTNTILVQKTYSYTTNNLVEKYTQGPNYSTTYGYDEMDRLKNGTLTYNDTVQAFMLYQSRTYTPEGKVEGVTVGPTSNPFIRMHNSYDLKQNKADVSFHNGLFRSAYTYDPSNNLTSIQYLRGMDTTPSLSISYEYDKSGNILKVTDRSGKSIYTYDANNQLRTETLPDGTLNEYQYDKVGNRLKTVHNGEATTLTYNDGNQIITKNGTNFSYDLDGNLKQDDRFKYEYNDVGVQKRTTSLNNTEVAKYEYDEEGLRTKKIVGTKTYEYYYEGEDANLSLEVTKENGQVQRYRHYHWDESGKAVGMVIKDKDQAGNWQTKTYYFWTNLRGDVTSIVNTMGSEIGSYSYDAYGNILSETGTIAKENPIRYASYYYDQETKQYYLKARYYDPLNGNFLSKDPYPGDKNNSLSQNGYSYAESNPITLVDTTGKAPNRPSTRIDIGGSNSSGGRGGSGRVTNVTKQQSPIWRKLTPVKGRNYKTSGKGKNKKYYSWDNRHNDIEVFNKNRVHLGSMDPKTGKMYKPPVKSRTLQD